MAEISAAKQNPWEQAHIAMGIAVYDPNRDRNIHDVIRRADEIMYENKRIRKSMKV
jgi:PleD family two-component response regulator